MNTTKPKSIYYFINRQKVKNLLPLFIIINIAFTAAAQNAEKQQSILIEEQGSFAVGGTIITTTGIFDPIKQGAYNPAGNDPAGQTLHGDHAASVLPDSCKSPEISACVLAWTRAVFKMLGNYS